MDEIGQGGDNGALALWWRATWANLLAILVCLVWFCVVQVAGLVKLIGWLFTLPVRVMFRPGSQVPMQRMPQAPPRPPIERRRS